MYTVQSTTSVEVITGRLGLGLWANIQWYGNVNDWDLGHFLWPCLQHHNTYNL